MEISARVLDYENISGHTEFQVQVTYRGITWMLSRRYSDFDQLHNQLQLKYKVTAQLPEKQWFGRFERDFLEKRKVKLQLYMVNLLQDPEVADSELTRRWLEVDKHLELHNQQGGGYGGDEHEQEERRLADLVENVTHTLIDISAFQHDGLEEEQVRQYQEGILQSCSYFSKEIPKVTSMLKALEEIPKGLPKNQVAQIVPLLSKRIPAETLRADQELLSKIQSFVESDVIALKLSEPSQTLIANLADETAALP